MAVPELPADFPLTHHASGQWCKKINGKSFYFGTDPSAALEKYLAHREPLEAGEPMPKPRKTKRTKAKPSADFPLFRHATGQWAKKIRGKLFYFGTDADAALAKYLDERDDRQAGREPRRKQDGLTLRDLCNRFLTSKKSLVQAGELSPRTWSDYYAAAENMLAFFGAERIVLDLLPEDFDRYRAKITKTNGPVGTGNVILRTRVILKWAHDNGLIDRPVRFGTAFRRPSAKTLRKAKQAGGTRMIEADELRRIIDAAGQPIKAMILLGLNCGFGASDLSGLPLPAIDLDKGWIVYPRPKTAVPRRAPLWGETIAALREAIDQRPEPKDPADAGLVFITKYGKRWVRFRKTDGQPGAVIDSVCQEFNKLLVKLGIKRRGSFYNLRHVFRTIADSAKDGPAANFIMGHSDGSMAEEYRERIDDARLLAVVNVVHDWLFPTPVDESMKVDPSILQFRATAG